MRILLTFLFVIILGVCVPGADEQPWHVQAGQTYPDLELSDFKGRVILLEPVGMTCKACNAFTGCQMRGGFAGIRPQQGLDSIGRYLARFGGTSLGYGHVVLVQWLIYELKNGTPARLMPAPGPSIPGWTGAATCTSWSVRTTCAARRPEPVFRVSS